MNQAATPPLTTRRSQFARGAQKMLPLLLGVAPFGMIYGVLARQVGLTPAAAQSMSSILFAGSSQFIATQMLQQHVPTLVLIIALFVVNLRHMLYSASIAPYLRRLSLGWKALLAYLMADEAYMIAVTHYQKEGSEGNQHWFFLGAGAILWTTWQISTAAGIFLGAVVPQSWELDFSLPLTFIALLVPILKNRADLAVALASGVIMLLVFSLPYKLGIIVAAMAGIALGMLLERRR